MRPSSTSPFYEEGKAMNDPAQTPPQRLPQTNPQGTAAPRPVISPAGGAPRAPIQPPPAQRLPGQPGHAPQIRPAPPPLPAKAPGTSIPLDDGELINLDDDDAPAPAGGAAQASGSSGISIAQISPTSKIKVNTGGDKHAYNRFKRDLSPTGHGATRVRTFHGRLSDDGLAYTDDKINEWLDNHPEVEVKHVNCFTGPLEGKVTGEQGLIVVIWY
jgi:hypothetical protein